MDFDWIASSRRVGRVEGGWVPRLTTFMAGGTGEAVTIVPVDAVPTPDRAEALRAAQQARWDRWRGWVVDPETTERAATPKAPRP